MRLLYSTFVFLFIAQPGFSNPAWKNCDQAMYQEALNLEKDIHDDADRGIRPKNDIFIAKSTTLDIGLCAGQIDKESFCKKKSEIIAAYAKSNQALVGMGMNPIPN